MFKVMCILTCLTCFVLIMSHRALSFPLNSNIGDIAAVINKLGGTSITITRRVQIYSKNSGHHIRVNGTRLDGKGEDGEKGVQSGRGLTNWAIHDRSVTGPYENFQFKARLMLESVNIKGYIRIRSITENKYICVSKRGTVKIEPKGNTIDRCVFVEDFHNGYTMFRSVYNNKWYLGIQKSGSAKAPRRTTQKQNASLFLIRNLP